MKLTNDLSCEEKGYKCLVLYIVKFCVEIPIFCNFMNLRVVIKPVFHDKYILASFSGSPEVLVVKGLNYVEYVVCWKQNEKDQINK